MRTFITETRNEFLNLLGTISTEELGKNRELTIRAELLDHLLAGLLNKRKVS